MSKIKTDVYWFTLKKPNIIPLQADINCDILIVGAGMAGMTCAHNLINKGLKVVVIEKEFVGGGASGRSSSFITPDSELEFADLVNKYEVEDAKKIWGFGVSGVEEVRNTIKKYNLNCDYQVQDSLFIANKQSGFKQVKDEYDLQKEHLGKGWFYEREKIPEILSSSNYFGAIRYDGTFGMVTYLYLQSLKEELIKQGVEIFEETKVTSIDFKINQNHEVNANGRKINAKKVIFCTDYFISKLGIIKPDSYHAQTFLTASKPLKEEEIKLIFPKEKLMVWDTDLIYQYYRVTGENRLLFGASSLFYTYLPKIKIDKTNVVDKIYKYQREKFGRTFEIEYGWTGLIGVSKDFLPLAGEYYKFKNVYYISGCAGLPWAAASGKYIAEKILKGRNDFDHFFRARRKYPVRNFFNKLISKPLAFAISHGLVKYFSQ